MLDQRFNARNLHKSLSKMAIVRHGLKPNKSKEQKYIHELYNVAKDISNKEFAFNNLVTFCHPRTNKTTFMAQKKTGIGEEMVIARLNFLIRRLFKIGFSDRNRISDQIKTILEDDFSGYIIKLDINSFYESIDTKELEKKLFGDRILAHETKWVLKKFFDFAAPINGLPRGLSISSSLSEYVLRDFDKKVRRISRVYYYARFVDDIIIFCVSEDVADIIKRIQECLGSGISSGLNFNPEKTVIYGIVKTQKDKDPWVFSDVSENEVKKFDFTYLGYCYEISKKKEGKKINKKISVSISEKKIKQTKTRIFHSVQDYKKNGNIELLKKRLSFLSGTYPIERLNKNIDDNTNQLKGGLCFTYPLVTNTENLRGIDRFMNQLLNNENINIDSGNYSFVRNFLQQTYHEKFKPEDINVIKECWKYA